ncbi:MAG: serine protease [Coprobacter sp.]|nr:serine protease [Coprobacter sp.]
MKKRLLLYCLLLSTIATQALEFRVADYSRATIRKLIEERIKEGTFEGIEGIWESSDSIIYAIERFEDERIPENFRYRVIQLEGKDVTPGKVDYFIELTTLSYLYHIVGENPFPYSSSGIARETFFVLYPNSFTFKRQMKSVTFSRIYPMIEEGDENSNWQERSTGSGFALTEDGYIATCEHVANGKERELIVTGVNGDFSRGYKARCVISDEESDVSILKITDTTFTGFGKIPYNIRQDEPIEGEKCIILGYPDTEMLGSNIKATEGIVSASMTEFFPTAFYTTAFVTGGNSGGALFDGDGNLLGIPAFVQRREVQLSQGAVRPLFLRNLIAKCDELKALNMTPAKAGRTTEQIIAANKPFVVLIYVNCNPFDKDGNNRTQFRFQKNIERVDSVTLLSDMFSDKRYDECIEFTDKLIKSHPKDGALYYVRAYSRHQLHDYRNALIDYSQCIYIYGSPRKKEDKELLATIYTLKAECQIDLDNETGAMSSIDAALELDDQNDDAHYFKGYLLYKKDQYKEALKFLNKIEVKGSNQAIVHHYRSLCYEALGERKKAAKERQKAEELGYTPSESEP